MAEELLNGKDYVIQIDLLTATTATAGTPANYKTVACEVSHEFNIDKETNQAANKCGGGWGRSTNGNKSWGVTGEYQAIDPATGNISQVSVDEMARLAAEDRDFWWRRGLIDSDSGAFIPYREGVVKATGFSETAGTDEPFTFSVTFEGQGAPILGQTT